MPTPGRGDPPARVEATAAGQYLPGSESEAGHPAANERGCGAVDVAPCQPNRHTREGLSILGAT